MRHAPRSSSRSLVLSVASAALLAGVACGQLPKAADKAEADFYDRGARAWAELAEFAAEQGAKSAAANALAEADAWGLAGSERDRLRARVEAAADGAASVELNKKDDSVRDRVVLLLDELGKRKGAEPSRAESFLFESLRVRPGDKKHCAALQSKVAASATAKDKATTARLLKRAPEVDAEGLKSGKYSAAETWLGKDDLIVVKAPGHPLEALVSLPKDWSAAAKGAWPAVVAFEGAGSDFAKRATDLKKAGEKRRYVVIVPITFSNTNDLETGKYAPYPADVVEKFKSMQTRSARLAWDFAGLRALMPALRDRFRLEEKVFITGYSGGGMPTYSWLLERPGEIAAACPVSANFAPELCPKPVAPSDGGPPVLLITGENDAAKERIFPQSEAAVSFLKDHGFRTVDRHHLKARQHEPFPDLCLDFFDEVRKSKK